MLWGPSLSVADNRRNEMSRRANLFGSASGSVLSPEEATGDSIFDTIRVRVRYQYFWARLFSLEAAFFSGE